MREFNEFSKFFNSSCSPLTPRLSTVLKMYFSKNPVTGDAWLAKVRFVLIPKNEKTGTLYPVFEECLRSDTTSWNYFFGKEYPVFYGTQPGTISEIADGWDFDNPAVAEPPEGGEKDTDPMSELEQAAEECLLARLEFRDSAEKVAQYIERCLTTSEVFSFKINELISYSRHIIIDPDGYLCITRLLEAEPRHTDFRRIDKEAEISTLMDFELELRDGLIGKIIVALRARTKQELGSIKLFESVNQAQKD